MNGCFIDKDGNYYGGDNKGGDKEVPQRPSGNHIWSEKGWIIDFIKQKKHMIDLIQAHVDSKAQAYGYDSILSASSYATSSNATWRTQGLAFRQWRDNVWGFGLTLLAAVEAGTNTIATEAELIEALPVFPLDE